MHMVRHQKKDRDVPAMFRVDSINDSAIGEVISVACCFVRSNAIRT